MSDEVSKISSTPKLTEFNPNIIPFQRRVLRRIRKEFDYNRGVNELLLSGSVGCLREDALVETVCGAIPICDIKESHFLLSHDHSQDQFCFAKGSGAFPKDKGTLYRVITTRGEFVASGHHRIATSSYAYCSVEDIFFHRESPELISYQEPIYPSLSQKLFLSNALRSWQTISNFLYHCVKHIHQCDPQLLFLSGIDLDAFPLQVDAQKYGQFFCSHKPWPTGDQLVREQELSRIFEECGHQSMQSFLALAENKTSVSIDASLETKLFEHSLRDILLFQQRHLHNCHPKILLFFLSKFGTALSNILKPYSVNTIENRIVKVEKLPGEDWYWDMQVPNTNNYLANGSVHHNSAKSILAAHIVVTHALANAGSQQLIVRRALKDLRATFWRVMIAHHPPLREWWNKQDMAIYLPNGSIIYGSSYDDGNFERFRSYELSGAVIEEGTESNDVDLYNEILERVGRLPHIEENFMLTVTNPDAPSHYLYESFMEKPTSNRKVFYSVTEDNPFLKPSYIKQLRETLDPKMAQRKLYGKWIEIAKDVVYYNYDSERNFLKETDYIINKNIPLVQSHDFNISKGKPMSAIVGQHIKGVFHIAKVFHVEGARTRDILEEMWGSGVYEGIEVVKLYGDPSGKNNDTRAIGSDYDIIEEFLEEKGIKVDYCVSKKHPPLRRRHNTTNAQFLNEAGQVNLYLYKGCEWLDKGLRLTQLKQGATLLEDDTLPEQHATTALGYWVDTVVNLDTDNKSRTIQL